MLISVTIQPPLSRFRSSDLRNSLPTRILPLRGLALVAMALLLGLLVWSYVEGGVMRALLSTELSAQEKVELLRTFFAGFGWATPLVYLAFVTTEVVVAPIPGTMLYAPGGVIFGGFFGGLLSLAGNVLGAGIASGLMRVVGGERAQGYLARSKLAAYETRISQHGAWIIFLLRVNPLTSSDLVSYAAGLTRIPVWKVMLGTLAGMAPLCFAQAYLAKGILTAFPRLIYPLLVACAIYTVVVLWIVNRLMTNNSHYDQQVSALTPD